MDNNNITRHEDVGIEGMAENSASVMTWICYQV